MKPFLSTQNSSLGAATNVSTSRFSLLPVGIIGFALLCGMAVPVLGVWVPAFVLFAMLASWAIADYRIGAILVLVLLHISGTVFIPRELLGIQGLNPINLLIVGTALSYVVSHTGRRRLNIPYTPSLLFLYLVPFMVAALYGSTKVHLIPSIFETMRLTSFSTSGGYFRDLFIKPLFVVLGSFLMALMVQESKRPANFIHVISSGCALLAGLVVAAFLISGASIGQLSGANARGFLSILGMHANEIGLSLNLGYAILLFSVTAQRGFSRVILIGVLCLIAFAVLLTFSRAAIVAFGITSTIFLIRRRQVGVLVVFFVIAIAIGLIFFDPIMARLGTGVDTVDRAQISAGRLDRIWLPLLDDFSASWLAPHGPSAIMWSRPMLNGTILFVGHTHSAYLGLLYDYGIIFGICIAVFLIQLFRQFQRYSVTDPDPALRHLFEGAAVAMIVVAIQGISDDRFTPTVAQTPLWCAIGILIGRGGLRQRKAASQFSNRQKQVE